MRNLIKKFSQMFKSESGSFAPIFTLALVPMMGAIGAAVDYSVLNNQISHLQETVDASALSAAIDFDKTDAERISRSEAFYNSHVNNPCTNAPTITLDEDKSTVVADCKVKTSFLGLVGMHEFSMSAIAVAVKRDDEAVCMLSLNKTAASSIKISGGDAHIDAAGCAIHSNSSHSEAINNGGSKQSVAESFCAVGGVKGSNFSATPQEGCKKVKDPFASLPVPDTSGCDFNNVKLNSNGAVTLDPGTYCGGIETNSKPIITMNPGLYIMKDGPFDINGTISGSEVTIYLYGNDATVQLTAQSKLHLTAPKSGVYEGMSFIQHPDAAPGKTSKFTGGSDIYFEGMAYFPTQEIEVGGSGKMGLNSPFMMFIADTFNLHGGELALHSDAAAAGFTNFPMAYAFGGAYLIQ